MAIPTNTPFCHSELLILLKMSINLRNEIKFTIQVCYNCLSNEMDKTCITTVFPVGISKKSPKLYCL